VAGALAELRRHVLPRDYPELRVSLARIVLLEAGSALLAGMDKGMGANALTKLQELGVEVRLQAAVAGADEKGAMLSTSIGDMAHVGPAEARSLPMLAPVAIQQGDLVAENILRLVRGQRPRRFRYRDRGSMVTIGRSAAVARIYGLRLHGLLAWLIWLTVHLVWLIGFRNRILVLVNWAWNYLTYDRAVRLIRRRR
jgi:NADH dehydrogenase